MAINFQETDFFKPIDISAFQHFNTPAIFECFKTVQ